MRRIGWVLPFIMFLSIATCDNKETTAPSTTQAKPPAPSRPTVDPNAGISEPPPPPSGGTLLRVRFSKGAKYERELRGTMQIFPVPGKTKPDATLLEPVAIAMDYVTEVSAIDNEIATLSITAKQIDVSKKAGEGKWVPPTDKGTIRMDARGRIYDDIGGLVSGVTGAGLIPLPTVKVNPGSKWSREMEREMPPFGPVRIKETYTYLGTRNIQGRNCHVVQFTGTGSLKDMSLSGEYIYDEDFMLLSANMKQTAIIEVPNSATTTSDTTVRIAMNVKVDTKRL